jgi:hypothetical protein
MKKTGPLLFATVMGLQKRAAQRHEAKGKAENDWISPHGMHGRGGVECLQSS